MQTKTLKTQVNSATSSSSGKTLKLNAYQAIQHYNHSDIAEGSMFIEENSLLFIAEGSLKIRYGKDEYFVCKNQIAFLKKNILVEYESDTDCSGKVEYVLILLKNEVVKEFTKLAELHLSEAEETSPVTVNTVDKKLLVLMDSLRVYFTEGEMVDGGLIKIKLLELLFCLSGNNDIILKQLLDLREHFRTDIKTTVEENVTNSLSLHQLAVLAGRSLSSFRRDFLAIYNMPPSQWIRQKRLEKARELLVSTTMTITDICYTTGFENIAHFSRLFKSQFRHSPSEFRLNMLVA